MSWECLIHAVTDFGGHGNNTIDYINNDQLNWLQESFCGWYGTTIGSHVTKSEKHVQSCSCYCAVSITTHCLSLAILCECFRRYYSWLPYCDTIPTSTSIKLEKQSCSCYCVVSITTNCLSLAIVQMLLNSLFPRSSNNTANISMTDIHGRKTK